MQFIGGQGYFIGKVKVRWSCKCATVDKSIAVTTTAPEGNFATSILPASMLSTPIGSCPARGNRQDMTLQSDAQASTIRILYIYLYVILCGILIRFDSFPKGEA